MVGIPLLCGLGAIGFLQVAINRAGAGLDEDLARVRAAGLPTDASQVKVDVPPSTNAAPIYTDLRLRLDNDKDLARAAGQAGPGGLHLTADQIAEQRAAYAKVGSLITDYERAADLPNVDFDHHWEKGFSEMFPEFATMKQGARLLAAKAEYQSAHGDSTGALLSIRRCMNIAHQAGSEPVIIGMLVQIALTSIAMRSLNRIVTQHRDDPRFLASALKLVEDEGQLPNFKKALSGEFALSRTSIQSLRSAGDISPDTEQDQSKMLDLMLKNPGMRRGLEAKYVHSFADYLLALPDDPHQWKAAVDVSKKVDQQVNDDKSVWNMLNQMLFPVFSQAGLAVGRQQTILNLAALQIRLYQAKLATGHFPKDLKAYGALAIDPFNGQELTYATDGTGFLIYSVGPDGVDDGGNINSSAVSKDVIVDTRSQPR